MNNINSRNGIILIGNVCIGYQLSTLLEKDGWKMKVMHQDKQAYERILKGNIHVVIADIEADRLGGLAVLSYCKRHWPTITTYGIAPRSGEPYLKSLAQSLGGCQGFFYLSEGKLEIDPHIGMAARPSFPHAAQTVQKKISSTHQSQARRN